MSSPSDDISLSANMLAVARCAGTSMLARRVRAATSAALRQIWGLLTAAADMRDDLRRMADDCEAGNPEQAARLRKLANSGWEH